MYAARVAGDTRGRDLIKNIDLGGRERRIGSDWVKPLPRLRGRPRAADGGYVKSVRSSSGTCGFVVRALALLFGPCVAPERSAGSCAARMGT